MYDCEKLRNYVTDIMVAAGLNCQQSRLFAESLVEADMRGVRSHGVTRLTAYSRRIREHLVNAEAEAEIIKDGKTLIAVDGKNGMGVTAANMAMQECIRRARQYGSCLAGVKGGNHFGIAAFFTEMAVRENMIGICASNGPSGVAPIGGIEPFLGTNPLSIALPAKRHCPVVLDMATSVVARGKITLAAKNGARIPENWGVNAMGQPTSDPNAVLNGGTVLPFGGAKGYGIALVIELLCSCLTGAQSSRMVGSFYDYSGSHQNLGFFLGAIDVSHLMPAEMFVERVDMLLDDLKAQPHGESVSQIFIPGEIEYNHYLKAKSEGIEISPAVVKELKILSEEYGVPFACEK